MAPFSPFGAQEKGKSPFLGLNNVPSQSEIIQNFGPGSKENNRDSSSYIFSKVIPQSVQLQKVTIKHI